MKVWLRPILKTSLVKVTAAIAIDNLKSIVARYGNFKLRNTKTIYFLMTQLLTSIDGT